MASSKPSEWQPETRFAVCIAAKFASPSDDSSDASSWSSRVARALHLDVNALPSAVDKADVARLVVPAELDLHLVTTLILVSLHLDEESTKHAKPDDERRYSARDRARVFTAAGALSIPPSTVHQAEAVVAEQLYNVMQEAKKQKEGDTSTATSSAMAAAASKSKLWRSVATGAGFVGGAVALGLTGGLAAPLIAPLLVTLTGGALGFLATSGGAVAIGLMFGLGGGGLSAYRTQSRVADIAQFEFERLDAADKVEKEEPPRLVATIVCSGLLLREDDYLIPWRNALATHDSRRDTWTTKAEVDFFLGQGRSLESWLKDKIISKGVSEVIKRTALNAFFSAVALPSTIYSLGGTFLDNNWQRSVDKANKVGDLLADVLEAEIQGKRPVVLIGSGLGASTVFRCLTTLDARGKRDLVADAHLISLPRGPSEEKWAAAKRVVSRRLTNAYSSNDWVLALVARLHSLSYAVAGLTPQNRPGVEDVDISDLLDGHLNLATRLPSILERINLSR